MSRILQKLWIPCQVISLVLLTASILLENELLFWISLSVWLVFHVWGIPLFLLMGAVMCGPWQADATSDAETWIALILLPSLFAIGVSWWRGNRKKRKAG